MTVRAGVYVLNIPRERRQVLLEVELNRDGWFYRGQTVAEPVPVFKHSRRAPLFVFAAFEDDVITHIAEAKKGASAGTNLVKLTLKDLTQLTRPIAINEVLDSAPPSLVGHLRNRLKNGGLLPPKSLDFFLKRMLELDESLRGKLARFSSEREQILSRLEPTAKKSLAIQKESTALALEIAGLERDELLAWVPDERANSFLDGLPDVRVREDVMLLADFDNIPGFAALTNTTHFASKTFVSEIDPENRLTVIMANRLPLEQQTGADLIYYNEKYASFVMVQYKAMEKNGNEDEFRWEAGGQFEQEIVRMNSMIDTLQQVVSEEKPDSYRFNLNPFFLKFCSRAVLNPDDKGLFKGIYLPLDLWKRLEDHGHLRGPSGGRVLNYFNVGRRLNNSEFVDLVSNAWVGTSPEQSAELRVLIRQVLAAGKSVTFAVKHAASDGDGTDRSSEDSCT